MLPALLIMMRANSKKTQILALFQTGLNNIDQIAAQIGARPSYVASVLQNSGMIASYFDLYTTSSNPMNVYSSVFKGKLAFRDEPAARKSVRVLDYWYRRFQQKGDRAGQHHAMSLALTMLNRARWSGKIAPAAIFREWLVRKLDLSVDDSDVPFHSVAL